jgi:hypothetical protein
VTFGSWCIDGATRDVDELTAMKLPVFATAVTPAGPWKNGPGTVGCPVACGHIVCHPGDAIFGDGDGVVVVARDEVAAIAAATENRTPQRKPSALTSGEPSPRDPDIHRIRRSYRTVAKSPPMMSKVLVANRGEIAIRPFHAACESSVAMRRVRTRSTREVGHSTTSGPLPT